MSERMHLPNRRGAVAISFTHRDQRFRVHIGYFAGGSVAEMFLDAARPNSALDAFAADALRRTPDGLPASLIGAAIDQLQAMERDDDGGER